MQRDRGALTRAAAAHNIGYRGEKSPEFPEEPRRIHAIAAVIVRHVPPAETRGPTRGHDEVPGQEGPQAAGGRADGAPGEGQLAKVTVQQ